jgi:hypothetical protein
LQVVEKISKHMMIIGEMRNKDKMKKEEKENEEK